MPDLVLLVLILLAVAGALVVTGAISYLAGRMRGQNDKIADLLDALLEEKETDEAVPK